MIYLGQKNFSILLVIIFSFLVLPNLSARTLWQDEAETALVARQMAGAPFDGVKTNTWLPYAHDDQGPISQDWNYQFSVSSLWRWHPWLQFYFTAVSFKLLGISAYSARIPFATLGIFTYWYFLNFLKKYGPKSNLFFLTAAILFLLSVPLLLHFRQSRYYALSVFGYLLTLDGYFQLDKKQSPLKYIIGSIFLFHSFLPGALALQSALLLFSAISFNKQKFIRFAKALLITFIFTLPWAIWLKIGGQNLNFDPQLIKQHLSQHYLYIHRYLFPFFLAIPFVFKKFRRSFFTDQKLLLFSIIISINLFLYTFNHPYFFRYLIPLVPLFTFISAWIIQRSPKALSIIGLIILIIPISQTLPGYLFEITHRYAGTNETLINRLSALDKKQYQTLATNYHDFTIRFHTNLKVFGAQQLSRISDCPNIIIIYPGWGNEDFLTQLAADCSLKPTNTTIPFSKLADSPNPIYHQYQSPKLNPDDNQEIHTLSMFLEPPAAN